MPTPTSKACFAFLITTYLCFSQGLAQPQGHQQPVLAESTLAPSINRLSADLDGYDRFYPIRWSEDLLDQRRAFLESQLEALSRLNFDTLSQTARVDALLMRNELRGALSENTLAAARLAEMDVPLAVRRIIVPLERARWEMQVIDARSVADQIAAVPTVINESRRRLELARGKQSVSDPQAAHLSSVAAQRSARALDELSETLARYRDHYHGFDPDFAWWCDHPIAEARKSLAELARYLRQDIAGIRGGPDDPLLGDPIGRQALTEALSNEFVAGSPEDLLAAGERELAWCVVQAREAAREMGFGDDWKAALDRIKRDSQEPGQQPAYVTAVAREAEAFVTERGLVTVPPFASKTWRVTMLSPQAQRTLPFAVYSGQAIGVAYPADSMPHADKLMSLRGNNRRFTRIVVPHELIPGHHLQGYMSQRERPERRRFSTPFSVEGWALYWEMKLWDLGWGKSPEDRLGMLFWRMHRCARIAVSLRFHLGEMKPSEMIDFLVTRIGHEEMGAKSEVRRYIGGDYSPLYQCGYMIGGLQLRALWREAVGSGRYSERAFNDAVLAAGPIPIELLRAELLGEADVPLTLQTEAGWRWDKPANTPKE